MRTMQSPGVGPEGSLPPRSMSLVRSPMPCRRFSVMPPAYNKTLLVEELRFVLEHLPRALKSAGCGHVIPRWTWEGKRASEPPKYSELTNVGRRAVGDPISKKQQTLKSILPLFEQARRKAAARILGRNGDGSERVMPAYSEATFISKLVRPLGDRFCGSLTFICAR